jgi:TonB family protein
MSVLKPAGVTTLALAVLVAVLGQEHLSDPPVRRVEHNQETSWRLALGDRPPFRVRNVMPVYPEAARAAGASGVVIVAFTIDVDGAVTYAKVARSVPLLDQAALDAVKQWRFEPALSDGVPVPAARVTAFTFPSRSTPVRADGLHGHQ